MHSSNARGLIDTIFSIAIIFILYGVFAGYWVVNIEETRKVALENQLTNLRYSVELYRMLEGNYPKDLRVIGTRCIALKERNLYGRKYLELQSKDKEGYPIDPYGNRFIYDNKTGIIDRR